MRVGAWLRDRLADGGLGRVAVWFFVLTMTAGTAGQVTTGALELVLFVGLALAFLAWEATQERWGRWGALLGAGIYVAGFAYDWVLALTLGLTTLALSLSGRVALPVAAGAFALVGWSWWERFPGAPAVMTLASLAGNVLMVYLLERVAATARALRETREELASLEVDGERTRLAEDLNAVIGNTLHQVGRQAAEARAALTLDDPALHDQLADVAALVERGLEQLELLSFEPVVGDFESEVATAQALCARLGVELTASVDELDERVDQTFALILRESVTNMFKHAIPARCTVAARVQDGQALLSFTNDGATAEAGAGASTGSGHQRWRDAVGALGGTLRADRLEGGRYRVVAQVPLDPPGAPINPPEPRRTHRAALVDERISHG